MATQDHKGFLRGKVGPVVYRISRGQRIVQSAPRPFQQSLSTKLNSHEFGLASNFASIIRQVAIATVDCVDNYVIYRLTGAIRKCLHQTDKAIGERDLHDADLSTFNGFDLNIDAPFERTLKQVPQLTVTEDGVIEFNLKLNNPKKDITYLSKRNDISAKLKVANIAFNFRKEEIQLLDQVAFTIEKRKALELSWTSDKNLPEGSFVFVMFSLYYYKDAWMGNPLPVSDSDYSSSCILNAFHVNDEMRDKEDDERRLPLHPKPTPFPNKLKEKTKAIRSLKAIQKAK